MWRTNRQTDKRIHASTIAKRRYSITCCCAQNAQNTSFSLKIEKFLKRGHSQPPLQTPSLVGRRHPWEGDTLPQRVPSHPPSSAPHIQILATPVLRPAKHLQAMYNGSIMMPDSKIDCLGLAACFTCFWRTTAGARSGGGDHATRRLDSLHVC